MRDEPEPRGGPIGRRPLPSDEYVAPRLDYLTKEVFPRAIETWHEIADGFVFVGARLFVPEAQATRAALTLYDIDREARRAIRIIAGRGYFEASADDLLVAADEIAVVSRLVEGAREATPRRLLRPAPIRLAGFELLHAERGSADFFLDAYGMLKALLLADPVQVALALNSIFGWPARVVIRRVLHSGRRRQEHDFQDQFEFKGNDLRIAGRLSPGSRLELRYRSRDGSELETTFENEH